MSYLRVSKRVRLMQRAGPRWRQRGSALVVTLLVFAIGMALVVPMYSEYTLLLKRHSNSYIAEQGYAYLRGGEELAAMLLLRDTEEDTARNLVRDDLSEDWAQQVPPYALDDGGWLAGKLEDLQGRFNLNSLSGQATETERFTVPQQQFIRLLQALEGPELQLQDAIAITHAVADWIDVDANPREYGAEDDYYYDATPPYRAANRALVSVSELRAIANVTPEIFRALQPLVTVWTADQKINIHTAPLGVLRSINSDGDLSPLTLEDGEQLIELRGPAGFAGLTEFLSSPVLLDRTISPGLRASLSESSNYFLFEAEVDVADRISRLYSVLHRQNNSVTTLVRASGSL
ncbi:general secretion pathway protein GspK [Halieaceae bacterium IMCC14734]|uniref:Type II secretion system protein K n=1 Tax=Candidatus Litorirhabdus singularis TaxID=2518993 RepID=A0ABT3TFI3_9GAMM|nr:type II secretion system minor pseudopilin GspK [Candidatus Litorirhabdus singularis]MCX2981048.1 general secretion pathway protein GspK [Candidatus Litorirhabdus singularis]